MKHIIYGLIDPRNNEIRYVGYTSNAHRRYLQHLYPSEIKRKTHKNHWLKQLIALHLKPEMIEICEYETEEELPYYEKMWIDNYRIIGCRLTNLAEGGRGGRAHIGHPHSLQTKMKIKHSKQHLCVITDQQVLEAIDLYQSGLSTVFIANKFNCSTSLISKRLRKQGVVMRDTHSRTKNGSK